MLSIFTVIDNDNYEVTIVNNYRYKTPQKNIKNILDLNFGF